MYEYAETLLKTCEIYRAGSESYADFAEETESRMVGLLFSEGDFTRFVDDCLRIRFSGSTASETELRQCQDFVTTLADKIYSRSDKPHKLAMLLISVLK